MTHDPFSTKDVAMTGVRLNNDVPDTVALWHRKDNGSTLFDGSRLCNFNIYCKYLSHLPLVIALSNGENIVWKLTTSEIICDVLT